MTEQLKPCPFCGGSAAVNNGPTYLWYVQCQECRIDGEIRSTKSEAIEAWNRRVHPAQPGAEPAPSAVVCGRCDGTGLDARYCNYQCEKCGGSGQAGAEPVAWVVLQKTADEIVRSKSLWKRFIDGTPLENDIACWMADFAEQFSSHPPARVPLTEDDLHRLVNEFFYEGMTPTGKHLKNFAHAIIAAYEAKNNIKE